MEQTHPKQDDAARQEMLDRLEQVCSSFQLQCQQGKQPSVEDNLVDNPDIDRSSLLARLLELEIEFRLNNGELPARDEYESRFPDQAAVVGRVFDTLDGTILDETLDDPPDASKISPRQGSAPRATANARTTMEHQTFGDYVLLESIARGGMGVVYRARQKSLDRIVALKMILSGRLADEEEVQRFSIEAEAAAKLDHPGIVPIYEVGELDGQHFFSMAYIKGESLSDRVRNGPLAPQVASKLVASIASAVAYAHDHGVIHRDLKPANILLDENEQPRITDFGLAKKVESGDRITATGRIIGTPAYMPPEQAAGQIANIGLTSDVYSLGAILYCLLTSRPPFQAASLMQTLRQVQEQEPVSPRQLNPDVDVDLDTICLKALQKEPHRRYATAQELADDLGRFLAGKPIKARPVGSITRAWMWCKRSPLIASLSSVAVSLLIAVAIVSWVGYVETGKALALVQERSAETESALISAQRSERLARQKTREALISAGNERTAKVDAIAARNEAQRAGAQALDSLSRARNSIMTLQIVRASEAVERDPYFAKQLLEDTKACPLDLRDFSWKLLHSRTQRNRLSIGAHARPFCIAYSPDSTGIAIGCIDGTIELFNADGAEIRRLSLPSPQFVWSLAFSPDGKHLAAASGNLAKSQSASSGAITVWETKSGSLIGQLGEHSRPVVAVAFSPNGRVLASGGQNQKVTLWETEGWSKRGSLPKIERDVTSIAFSPDSQTLVLGGGNPFANVVKGSGTELPNEDVGRGEVSLWNVEEQSLLRSLEGHARSVTCVAVSPDSKWIVSSSIDNSIKMWDLQSGLLHKILDGHGNPAFSVAFSPDGKTLATAARVSDADPDSIGVGTGSLGEIKLWDTGTGRQVSTLKGHVMAVTGIAYSPKGDAIASVSLDGSFKLWNAVPRLTTRDFQGSVGTVRSLAVSPDGKILASSCEGPEDDEPTSIFLWDVETGMRLKELTGHQAWVSGLSFSPDGSTLASASHDKSIRLWDVESGQSIRELRGHTGSVFSVQYSSDESRIASAGEDKTIRVWNLVDDADPLVLVGHKESASDASFSPDGQTLVSAGYDGILIMWDPVTGKRLKTLRGHAGLLWNSVTATTFAPDGKTLASGSYDTTAMLWDAVTGRPLLRLSGHRLPVRQVAFTDDGRTLATSAYGDSIRLWDAETGMLRVTMPNTDGETTVIAFGPDGDTFFAGLSDGRIRMWNVRPEQDWALLRGHHMSVTSVALSPDSSWLASGAYDRTVKLWDVKSGSEKMTLTGHTEFVTSVAISSDGTLLASGDQGKTIKIWNAQTGEELQSFLAGRKTTLFTNAVGKLFGKPDVQGMGFVYSMAFSPDGLRLAAASFDNEARIWDVRTGSEQQVLKGHTNSVLAVCFGPEGKIVATGSTDGTARIWDSTTGAEIKKFAGHVGGVMDVKFNRDGRFLICGSGDNESGEIKIWDTKTGELRKTLNGHKKTVTALAVSDDGQTMVSSSMDHSINLWNLQTESLVDTLIQRTEAALPMGKPIAMNGNASVIVSGGPDANIQIWQMTPVKHNILKNPPQQVESR